MLPLAWGTLLWSVEIWRPGLSGRRRLGGTEVLPWRPCAWVGLRRSGSQEGRLGRSVLPPLRSPVAAVRWSPCSRTGFGIFGDLVMLGLGRDLSGAGSSYPVNVNLL